VAVGCAHGARPPRGGPVCAVVTRTVQRLRPEGNPKPSFFLQAFQAGVRRRRETTGSHQGNRLNTERALAFGERAQRDGGFWHGLYQIITERIIEKLEQGTVPWHKPWRSVGALRNLVSKKPYRGVNVWLLTAQSYTSPYLGDQPANQRYWRPCPPGGKITPVVFWRIYVNGIEVKEGD